MPTLALQPEQHPGIEIYRVGVVLVHVLDHVGFPRIERETGPSKKSLAVDPMNFSEAGDEMRSGRFKPPEREVAKSDIHLRGRVPGDEPPPRTVKIRTLRDPLHPAHYGRPGPGQRIVETACSVEQQRRAVVLEKVFGVVRQGGYQQKRGGVGIGRNKDKGAIGPALAIPLRGGQGGPVRRAHQTANGQKGGWLSRGRLTCVFVAGRHFPSNRAGCHEMASISPRTPEDRSCERPKPPLHMSL